MKMNLESHVSTGLQELSGSLDAQSEFLEIDEDLVEVAAQASEPLSAGPSRKELSARIRGLTEKDKDELLIAAAGEQGERWRNDFMRRFRRTDLLQPSDVPVASERRKVGNLLAAAHARAKERARLLNEQRIAEAAVRATHHIKLPHIHDAYKRLCDLNRVAGPQLLGSSPLRTVHACFHAHSSSPGNASLKETRLRYGKTLAVDTVEALWMK